MKTLNYLFDFLQGAMVGYLAVKAFPGNWSAVVTIAVLVGLLSFGQAFTDQWNR
jgi:hypothetical protein